MEEDKKKKAISLRLTESLRQALKVQAQKEQISVNDFINLSLTDTLQKQVVSFEEKTDKLERKEIESRVYFTMSEVDILKSYALSNGWSLSKEIRYRVVSSFARKPKLSGEELKAIYTVRSSMNVLGANLNRLLRNHTSLSDDNVAVCQELVLLMRELKEKINYLEKSSCSRFKLKDVGGRDGG